MNHIVNSPTGAHVRVTMNVRRALLVWSVVLSVVIGPACWGRLQAQTTEEVEYRLKAVYLLNFLHFVEWPDSTFTDENAPVVLGIMGRDPFGKILDEALAGEQVGGRPIVIRRLKTLDGVDECHALFIASSEKAGLADILEELSGSSVLTVSDMEGFDDAGGGIGFYIERNKVRFSINIRTMRIANLKVSSKLLRLARIVEPS